MELLSDSTQGITCTCGRVREEGGARGKDRAGTLKHHEKENLLAARGKGKAKGQGPSNILKS